MLSTLLITVGLLALNDDIFFAKSLVKSFQYNGEKNIELDLPGEVSVSEWDEPFIRVQLNIELKQSQKKIFRALLLSGRYSIRSQSEKEVLLLDLPKYDLEVAGKKIKDKISYIIYVPRYVKVKNLRQEVITSGLEDLLSAQ